MEERKPDIRFFKSYVKEIENKTDAKIKVTVYNYKEKRVIVLFNSGKVAVKDIIVEQRFDREIEKIVYEGSELEYKHKNENLIEIKIPKIIQPEKEGRVEIFFNT